MRIPLACLALFSVSCLSTRLFGDASLILDSPSGEVLTITGTFTSGVCTIERAESPEGPWGPVRNVFTTRARAEAHLDLVGRQAFFRALAVNLADAQLGFSNLVESYSLLETVAGAGGATGSGINKWQEDFEGKAATSALLSRPHIAMADRAGSIFIADKDAHAIRKVRPDGAIVTVAGVNIAGNGPDGAMPGRQVALSEPNGLWVQADGTCEILDLGNGKVRRLDTNGVLTTLFTIPGLIAGRGLWVNEQENLAYVASATVVKRWTLADGVVDYAKGFGELGNLVVDPGGSLVVTDRGRHRVYRCDRSGNAVVIAGNGLTAGGGDGQPALATGLEEVRGVWFLPTGAYFLATHRGSQLWYVDTSGIIHLFLNGHRSGTHGGDGTWFYNPSEYRISELRAVTMDFEGNVLVTEHDSGYVRRVRFLRHVP